MIAQFEIEFIRLVTGGKPRSPAVDAVKKSDLIAQELPAPGVGQALVEGGRLPVVRR
jgi:hypothetical protein